LKTPPERRGGREAQPPRTAAYRRSRCAAVLRPRPAVMMTRASGFASRMGACAPAGAGVATAARRSTN